MSEWINTKDKRPEDKEFVLCRTNFDYKIFQWDEQKKLWCGRYSAHSMTYVNYWMSLPELPKEGE